MARADCKAARWCLRGQHRRITDGKHVRSVELREITLAVFTTKPGIGTICSRGAPMALLHLRKRRLIDQANRLSFFFTLNGDTFHGSSNAGPVQSKRGPLTHYPSRVYHL